MKLEVPVYLYVGNITTAYPDPKENQIIGLFPRNPDNQSIVFYNMPPYPDGIIPVSGYDKISFTLSNNEGINGNLFWLTYFETTDGPIIAGPSPNQIGSIPNDPPNVMTLDIKPDLTGGKAQTFRLHCYFIFFDQSKERNVVYHCSIDPQLRTQPD